MKKSLQNMFVVLVSAGVVTTSSMAYAGHGFGGGGFGRMARSTQPMSKPAITASNAKNLTPTKAPNTLSTGLAKKGSIMEHFSTPTPASQKTASLLGGFDPSHAINIPGVGAATTKKPVIKATDISKVTKPASKKKAPSQKKKKKDPTTTTGTGTTPTGTGSTGTTPPGTGTSGTTTTTTTTTGPIIGAIGGGGGGLFGGLLGNILGMGGAGGGGSDGGAMAPAAPAPQYVQETAAAVPVVQTADESAAAPAAQAIDLELLEVRQIDAGDAENGPAYRVVFRNNSAVNLAQPFDIAIYGSISRQLTSDVPQATVRVESMQAGESLAAEMRLPVEANSMGKNASGNPVSFTWLTAVVDAGQTVQDAARDNNSLMLNRNDVPMVEGN